ncbi:MAG: aldehyde dehydrogenase [Lachnospiraceae bacterium]|nr:aldehyde dehydrogenase [Lachnospiraceae bacterium]
MDERELQILLARQRSYFASGKTRSFASRMHGLEVLKKAVKDYEKELAAALKKDLGKSSSESYMCETGLVLSELNWMMRHLKNLMREKTVATPLSQFAARSIISPSPYGNVLIMSPWNYPVLLTLNPLVDALAAGNTVILKPSAYAPASSQALKNLIEECFPSRHVAVVTGGRRENQALLKQRFDKIFFTGSQQAGQEVLRHAAEHLTPVTLELGGKSPCIVDKSAKIGLAARRIVFGKYLNCGQTCVAPDYILCDERICGSLTAAIQKEIVRQFGANPLDSPVYGKIINAKHFHRILKLIDPDKLVCGGGYNEDTLRIAPTVLKDVTFDDAVMQEEIFGPVLPILTYRSLEEAITAIESRPHPLALYLFSEDPFIQKKVLSHCRFGGGCINDTVIHLATSAMPFGGVGESGMGGYHGETGFQEFCHTRSIVDKKTWMDLPIRYQPYSSLKNAMLKMFLN